jgi:hypothetical protein
MKKIAILYLPILVGVFACGGDTTSNVQACRDLVNKVNSLECMESSYVVDADATCPPQFDEIEGDYSAYYQCVEDAYQCVDGLLELGDILGCSSKMPTASP